MTAPRCELINIAGQAGGGCAAANQRFPRLPGASASPRPVAAVCLPRSPRAWDLGLLQLCACRAPLPGHMPAAVHEYPGLKLLANLNQSPWFSLEFRSVLFNPGPENTTACCHASPPGKIEPTFDSREAKETSLLLKRYCTRKRGCFQARQELALSPPADSRVPSNVVHRVSTLSSNIARAICEVFRNRKVSELYIPCWQASTDIILARKANTLRAILHGHCEWYGK